MLLSAFIVDKLKRNPLGGIPVWRQRMVISSPGRPTVRRMLENPEFFFFLFWLSRKSRIQIFKHHRSYISYILQAAGSRHEYFIQDM